MDLRAAAGALAQHVGNGEGAELGPGAGAKGDAEGLAFLVGEEGAAVAVVVQDRHVGRACWTVDQVEVAHCGLRSVRLHVLSLLEGRDIFLLLGLAEARLPGKSYCVGGME